MTKKSEKRPVTLAEWEKSDETPSHKEIRIMLQDVKDKRDKEIERLKNSHELSMKQLLQEYNMPRYNPDNQSNFDQNLRRLQQTASRGDQAAIQRVKQLEEGQNAVIALLEKQKTSHQNLQEEYNKFRNRVLAISKRLTDKETQAIIEREETRKLNVEYMKLLEKRILQVEQSLPEMKKVAIQIAKVEFAHTKVRELEQELYRLKQALVRGKILEVEDK